MTPKKAREYIENFVKYIIPNIVHVDTPSKRIYLNNMTDEEAIFVAEEFTRMEIEAAKLREGPLQ